MRRKFSSFVFIAHKTLQWCCNQAQSGGNKVKLLTACCKGQISSQEYCCYYIAKLFLYLDIVRPWPTIFTYSRLRKYKREYSRPWSDIPWNTLASSVWFELLQKRPYTIGYRLQLWYSHPYLQLEIKYAREIQKRPPSIATILQLIYTEVIKARVNYGNPKQNQN